MPVTSPAVENVGLNRAGGAQRSRIDRSRAAITLENDGLRDPAVA
jgi:hypothetical protein